MEKGNNIESLKSERNKIITEEKLLSNSFKRAFKLETVLKDTFNLSLFIGFILLTIGVAIWAHFYYEAFTWSLFWYHLFIIIYPGCFVCMFIASIIDHLTPFLLHKLYRISKKDLEAFKIRKKELFERHKILDKKITDEESKVIDEKRRKDWVEKRAKNKEDEIALLNSLRELIRGLENKKVGGPEANEWIKLLFDDHIKIKTAGYQIEKSITYTNLFKKIERLQNPHTSSIPILPIPKSVEITEPTPKIVEPDHFRTLTREYQESARQQYYRIVNEAYFDLRLDWFLSMLLKGQCPKKQAVLIHTLLKQEFQDYSRIGFIIHPLEHYTKKGREIYSIIMEEDWVVEKEISTSIIPNIIEPSPSIPKLESSNSPSKVEDKTVTEIFGEPKFGKIVSQKEKTFKPLPKLDYQVVNKQKMDIGDAGELYIYWKEKNKLFDSGFKHLSDKVQLISKESDSYGYDIISYFDDGTPIYLEVKTTIGGPKTPFDISNAEFAAMNNLDNYYIVRVFDFNIETGKGSSYTVNKSQFGNHFDIEPTSYRAKPKR